MVQDYNEKKLVLVNGHYPTNNQMCIRDRYKLVKAADKLAAYVKCLEEGTAGNREFDQAEKSIKKELNKYAQLPEVAWFIDNCLDAFTKTLDELG